MQTDVNDRPPYVQWETRAIEDRSASLAAGHYVAKDVDFAVIMRPGSRDKLEKEAVVWLSELRMKDQKNEIPPTWFPAFQASFKAWKEGEEEPLNGTSVKLFPVLTPSQLKTLQSAGIKTIEDLAQIPDQDLGILGIGGLNLKLKARAWLEQAVDKGKLAEENASLKTQMTQMQEQLNFLTAELGKLKEPKK
jgi:hypothetical protein